MSTHSLRSCWEIGKKKLDTLLSEVLIERHKAQKLEIQNNTGLS